MTALPTVEVHLDARDLHDQLVHDARVGLTSVEKWIPATWFYDDHGSELFDRITELAEYYPTRAERSILRTHADEIAAAARATTLVELGSGTSEKTTLLLDAMERAGRLRRFVAFDVAAGVLREALGRLSERLPEVELHGVVGDFRRHLPELLDATAGQARTVTFLGGTIGNLNRTERHEFLTTLRSGMTSEDSLLLGTDLVKSPARLVAAYDDAAGVTAEFDLNVLRVLNRELDGDLPIDAFRHVAVWNVAQERIEMRLRATEALAAHLGELDLTVFFADGEELLTEISCKFRPDGLAEELAIAGFAVDAAWTDADGDFLLTLARPTD